MLPMFSLISSISKGNSNGDFKYLLNVLQLDTVGDYTETDLIILMIGTMSLVASKRKR